MSERTPPKKPTLKPDLPRPPAMTPEFKEAERAKAEPAIVKPTIPGWMWVVLITVLVAVAVGAVILHRT